MATFKSKYKRFNGLTWDDFHFETSPEQVIGLQDLLDDKVDVSTAPSQVYSTGSDGKQLMRSLTSSVVAQSVPLRTSYGSLTGADARTEQDLVPFGQLNTLLLDYGKLVDVVDLSTNQLIKGTKTFDAAVHLNNFLEFKTGGITKNTLKTNPLNDRLHVVQGNGKSGDLALVSEVEDKVSISAFNMQMLEKLNIKPDGSNLLIVGGKINPMYIDSASTGSKHEIVSSQVEMLALVVPKGTVAIRTDEDNKPYILVDEPASTLANWKPFSSGGITGDYIVSINDKSGIINLLAMSDIDGLSQALNLKLDATTFATEVNRLEGLINNKENSFSKKTAFNKDFGTTSGTVVQGNDPRMTNARPASDVSAWAKTAAPSALRFMRMNANNTITWRTAADFRGDIGAGTSNFSGSYNDLTNKPSIPAAQVQSNWNAITGMGVILNKPNLATVATSGSYADLSNKPTIPSEYALTKSKIETALKGVGDDSITLGYAASTAGIRSIALGYNASAAGIRSTALGYGTSAEGSYSTALGYNANAEGSRSAALGHQAEALGIFSTAIGQTASASGGGSTALGSGTIAESQSSIAIGVNAKALGNFSIALGAGSKAEGLNSIAIGVSTIVTDDNVADFGEDRQVRVNLAPEHDRDAVSKKYLEDNFVELLKNLPNI